MAVVKKTSPSKIPLEISKSHQWGDDEAFVFFPDKDQWRKRLIYSMISWAEKSTSIEIGQFCLEYKIPYFTLRDWTYKYPDLAKAYKHMKHIIASHRKVGCMTKKLDYASCFKDMHTLDEDWIEVDKYHNNLKKDIQNDNTTKVIVLSQLDTGELVPVSGKKDETPLLPE